MLKMLVFRKILWTYYMNDPYLKRNQFCSSVSFVNPDRLFTHIEDYTSIHYFSVLRTEKVMTFKIINHDEKK